VDSGAIGAVSSSVQRSDRGAITKDIVVVGACQSLAGTRMMLEVSLKTIIMTK